MKILVTGSNGQLGKGIKKYLKYRNYDFLFTSKKEIDICKKDETVKIVRNFKPNVIINCAAATEVDFLEKHVDSAFLINAQGAKNIAEAAQDVNAKIVHLSTDYVFDGRGIYEKGKIRPYRETDATNPKTVYGKSKLLGEKLITESTNSYFIIRTAWLFGEGRSFISRVFEKIRDKDSIQIINDQWGSPTSVKSLVGMIDKLINTDAYGLYHGVCEGVATRYELIYELLKQLGIKYNIYPCSYKDYKNTAERPVYSALENKNLYSLKLFKFPHWVDAIAEYINQDGLIEAKRRF